MQFYAHTHGEDRGEWEPLSDHLRSVEATARRFGEAIGIGNLCGLAAILHDLGKFDPDFQRRLVDPAIRVDHSTAGAALALDRAGEDAALATLVAQAIAGHHAGLTDRRGSAGSSLEERIDGFDRNRLAGDWAGFVPETLAGIEPGFDWRKPRPETANRLAMLGRMVFSCLVDADFLETERFYVERGELRKDRDWPSLAECLPAFREAFEATIAAFDPDASRIAGLRAEILSTVRERAVALEPGLFTLDVPTGGGKTLASLGFALDHAAKWGHRRIIVSIPYTGVWIETQG